MLVIRSEQFEDFVFQGQSIYTAKQLWQEKHQKDTRLVEINEITKLIFKNYEACDWLLVDNDNNVIATIVDADKMKARQKENQKPVSNIFWFNGDTCSINLDSVERTIYYSDTGVIDIHLKSTSLVILGGNVAKQFIAQYKAFTSK